MSLSLCVSRQPEVKTDCSKVFRNISEGRFKSSMMLTIVVLSELEVFWYFKVISLE